MKTAENNPNQNTAMQTDKITVARFWLQSTPSFPEAPQREEYDGYKEFHRAGIEYEKEWRAMYTCGDANCKNRDCPQHFPEQP